VTFLFRVPDRLTRQTAFLELGDRLNFKAHARLSVFTIRRNGHIAGPPSDRAAPDDEAAIQAAKQIQRP